MFITRAINKDLLANIVQSTFLQFGNFTSSSLLDSLKFLGFSYATSAGISINIEDLKTPEDKKQFLESAQLEIQNVSKEWQQGKVSDIERFQSIIDTWNSTTELLKNRITEYYDAFDPANNLYIMAFSGARGNMSQVRQLVGMRGLMSDQDGRIIDIPILANFREGLTSIDYIISSYGARKGIVDTALKTADSGYLTRRLIYVAQDLIIREIDCSTKEGLMVLLNKNTSLKSVLGRTINTINSINTFQFFSDYLNLPFEERFWKELQPFFPLEMNVRSSLTCKSNGSVCQKCYGWDLAQSKLISLGEAVGIIAAQSIGEPGTQLTMRTFHTGGIFTGEMVKQIQAPISGKLLIPTSLKLDFIRTYHGKKVIKLDQEIRLNILDWTNQLTEIYLPRGSYLYIFHSCFVKKNEKIAEYGIQNLKSGKTTRKPVFMPISGEISFENLAVKPIKNNLFYTMKNGVVWVSSGKIFSVPKELDYFFPKKLLKEKSFGHLKIIVPFEAIIQFPKDSIRILTSTQTLSFELGDIVNNYINCLIKFSPTVQNNQYVEKNTIIGFIEFYPLHEGLIYSLKKKVPKEEKEQENKKNQDDGKINKEKKPWYMIVFFFITESDIWKINSDQINNYSFYKKKKYIRPATLLNSNSKFNRTGTFLKKDGFQFIFQNSVCLFFPKGTILKYGQGNLILEKKLLAKLKSYVQQTEDIVQGLPKIEELIEARKPKEKAVLAERSGVIITNYNAIKAKVENFGKIGSPFEIECILPEENPIEDSEEDTFDNLIEDSLEDTLEELFENSFENSFDDPLEESLEDPLQESLLEKDLEKQSKKKNQPQICLVQNLLVKRPIVKWDDKIFEIIPLPLILQLGTKKKKNRKTGQWVNEFGSYVLYNQNGKEQDNFRFYKTAKLSVWTRVILKFEKNEKLKIPMYKGAKISDYLEIESEDVFSNECGDLLIQKKEMKFFIFLRHLTPIVQYPLRKLGSNFSLVNGKFVDIGEPLTEGLIDVHDLLNILFQYHSFFDGTINGINRSRIKFQLILVNSIQAIYQSQGVNISTKHIEIIVRQMMTKVIIKQSGDTPMLPGEIINFSLIIQISKILERNALKTFSKIPKYEPILMSASTSSLNKDGFLSAAGFQETKRVLTKAAIEGSCDWLRGLKECIIVGRVIPAGSAFLNYKNYLDTIYLFKNLKEQNKKNNG